MQNFIDTVTFGLLCAGSIIMRLAGGFSGRNLRSRPSFIQLHECEPNGISWEGRDTVSSRAIPSLTNLYIDNFITPLLTTFIIYLWPLDALFRKPLMSLSCYIELGQILWLIRNEDRADNSRCCFVFIC